MLDIVTSHYRLLDLRQVHVWHSSFKFLQMSFSGLRGVWQLQTPSLYLNLELFKEQQVYQITKRI